MTRTAIVTVPPYAPFIGDVLKHKSVSGIRLNIVMPTKEPLEDLLKRLDGMAKTEGKDLWIDLKCRQLRVKTYGVPPFTEIELTHEVTANTPVTAYFSGGKEHATVVGIEGNKLVMLEGPRRVVGPGESVNIPDPSLKINGYFTDTDKRYIEAAQAVGVKNIMLSFVEGKSDIDLLKELYQDANVVAKIESTKGLLYVANDYSMESRLMAARGDLFVELGLPHFILGACEKIVQKDKDAIVASRLLSSLADSFEPSCEDIGDVDNLLRMGYKTIMLGDEVCMRKESVISALNLYSAIIEGYS